MKRLVLCFDGTWNAVADPKTVTNVVRLANLVTVSHDGVQQITYYNSGVGSGGPIDRFLGGAFGMGLKSNVKRGLAFLALNYEEGDEIYLFGFSRGAYTARALAGVVGAAGIPLDISQTETHWTQYQKMAKLKDQAGKYKKSSPKRVPIDKEVKAIRGDLAKLSRNEDKPVPIRCVGVFDTVGAYGIPSGMGLGAIPHLFTYWTRGFRDTRFGKSVELGLHAMAIDEMRKPFVPTFWTLREDRKLEQAQEVEQVWFPGVHSNVGGGYDDCGLSDLALAWMVSRVRARTGLKFNDGEVLEKVWPCTACTIYRSSSGGMFAGIRNIMPGSMPMRREGVVGRVMRYFRGEPLVKIRRVNEKLHWSVRERCGWETTLVDGVGKQRYAPANLGPKLADVVEPNDFELKLLERTREWKGHCSLEAAGLECQCKTRGAAQAKAQPQSVAAE